VNRHLLIALTRVACTVIFVFLAFNSLHRVWRRGEARFIANTLRSLGVPGATRAYGPEVLVSPARSAPFLATLSPSCSSLGAILAFTAMAVFLLHGPPHRRLAAVLLASCAVAMANFVRIGLALGVGARYGEHAMVVFHDWVGTIIGLFSVLGGFTVFVFVLLPSNKRLLEAALAR